MYQSFSPFMAEKERFELSNGFTRYTISSRAPSTKLGDFSTRDKHWLVNEKYFTTKRNVRQVLKYIFFVFACGRFPRQAPPGRLKRRCPRSSKKAVENGNYSVGGNF